MLGLGAALGGPYGAPLGAHSTGQGGGWQGPGLEYEAEFTNLKTSIDATQRSMVQLENKLSGRLEHICRRHVEDSLASSGPLQELKQGLSRLQHECRHWSLEAGRLPSARDVDEALERNKKSIEEWITERIDTFERNVSQQQQIAMERLDGHSSESWRACLQNMATLQEKLVLQTDIPRLMERALNEVKRAGPELFAGISPSAADVSLLKTALRRLEAKLAGCEARVLGISDDSNAEGRVWRASIGAKVETIDRMHQDISGRLAGCEAGLKASEENMRHTLETVHAAASDAQKRAQAAETQAWDAKDDALRQAEAVLQQTLSSLESRAQERAEAHRRDVNSLQKHLNEMTLDLVPIKRDTAEAGKDRVRTRESLAGLHAEIEKLSANLKVVSETANEVSDQDLQHAVATVREEAKVSLIRNIEPLKASFEQLSPKVGEFESRCCHNEQRFGELKGDVARMDARIQAMVRALEPIAQNLFGHGAVAGPLAAPTAAVAKGPAVAHTHAAPVSSARHSPNQAVGPSHIGSAAAHIHLAPASSARQSPSQVAAPSHIGFSAPTVTFQVTQPALEPASIDSSASPVPDFGFDHGIGQRPPSMPATQDLATGVAEPSFGEHMTMQTSASHMPFSLSPGEVQVDASMSAVMSATPSRVPGETLGEETGLAPSAFGLEDEGANSWDEDDDGMQPPVGARRRSNELPRAPVPGLESEASDASVPLPDSRRRSNELPRAPVPGLESEPSDASVPLPDSGPALPGVAGKADETVSRATSSAAAAPAGAGSSSDALVLQDPVAARPPPMETTPLVKSAPPPPPPAPAASGTGSVDTAAAMQIAAEFGSPARTTEAKEATSTARAPTQSVDASLELSADPSVMAPELAESDWDASASFDAFPAMQAAAAPVAKKAVAPVAKAAAAPVAKAAAAPVAKAAAAQVAKAAVAQSVPKAAVGTPQPRSKQPEAELEPAASDWDSVSMEGNAAMQAAAAAAVASVQHHGPSGAHTAVPAGPVVAGSAPRAVAPQAMSQPQAQEPEAAESDWDVSASMEGNAAMQAAAAAAARAVPQSAPKAATRHAPKASSKPPAPDAEPVGSDWDSMSMDENAAMQAAAAAAAAEVPHHHANASGSWDSGANMDLAAAAAEMAGRHASSSPAVQSASPAEDRPRPQASKFKSNAPAVGLGGAQQSRFSSAEALQEGTSFDDDDALPGLEASMNSWDGSPAGTPAGTPHGVGRRSAGKRPVAATPAATMSAPATKVATQAGAAAKAVAVNPKSGALAAAALAQQQPSPRSPTTSAQPDSARQAAKDMGFDSEDDFDDADGDLSDFLPG